MSYAIDTRLLRAAGDLLAAGNGHFSLHDYEHVCDGMMEGGEMKPPEQAAWVVMLLAVHDRCNAKARVRIQTVVDLGRDIDPQIEPWVVRAVSATLLQRGVALIAGRGATHKVSLDDLKALIGYAVTTGPGGSSLSGDESLAFLVLFEMLHGRTTPEAQELLERQSTIISNAGFSLDGAAPTSGSRPSPAPGFHQCGACEGTGTVTCGSCGGVGYHQHSRTRQRYDGSTEYYQENVPCSCNGGRLHCAACGGTGRVR
jgi:hypothetical protein